MNATTAKKEKLGLAAGGDPKVGRPGRIGRCFGRLADGSKGKTYGPADGRDSPTSGETVTLQAAAPLLRGRSPTLSGAACSTRMNAPSRVLNRNFASINAPSNASHDAGS